MNGELTLDDCTRLIKTISEDNKRIMYRLKNEPNLNMECFLSELKHNQILLNSLKEYKSSLQIK